MNIKGLRDLIEESSDAKTFFEDLASRVKNYRVTTVDQAMRRTGAGRSEIVDIFKKMESFDLGTFVVGRRNGVSRFEWSVGMVETAQAAFGEIDEIQVASAEIEDDDADDEQTQAVKHSFVLRQDQTPLSFYLPKDLTEKEAERLAKFIQSLPING